MIKKQLVVSLQNEDEVVEALTFNRENGYVYEIVSEYRTYMKTDCVALLIKNGYTLTVTKNNTMIFWTDL